MLSHTRTPENSTRGTSTVANLLLLTLNLYAYFNVIEQVLYTYKQRVKLIFDLCIFIKQTVTLNILTVWYQLFPEVNMPLPHSLLHLWIVTVFPKYLKFDAFSKDLPLKLTLRLSQIQIMRHKHKFILEFTSVPISLISLIALIIPSIIYLFHYHKSLSVIVLVYWYWNV
jgi:hypothetical protein